ncbi:MAG: AEC family transporter [Candidatus Omnitrophica bacterium]|nr:AEC family transporter [Candidatus Omnitrophota bacterium]MBU1894382.1 AEC family transporter [Candidatus Omnitrophota bacterium]
MEMNFSLYTISGSIVKLFILMLIGYFLYQRKIVNDKFVDTLSLLLVRVVFPALIISKTITHFSFNEYAFWWFLPLTAVIFSGICILLGSLIYPFLKNFNSQKEFLCGSAFHNCGYLPMNLIFFSFTGLLADKLLIYTFLFIVGFNVLMWSIVPLFLSRGKSKISSASLLLNPPVLATVFSLGWVALMGKGSMPSILMDPIKQLGQAAFPLSMITLGAYLCRYRAHNPEHKTALAACSIIKLFIFPVIIFIIMKYVNLSIDYKFFLFLQSIMPTAVSLVVIGSYVNCDNKFLSSTIFYTHLVSIVSIPLWLILFGMFIK